MISCGVLKKGDRLSKILWMEYSRIFTELGGPWNEFQKVCRDYFKYSGSFAHSLSGLCLGTEAGGLCRHLRRLQRSTGFVSSFGGEKR